jgi:hypothetical protein
MLASQWRSKARALAHLRTVPVNPPQPPRCSHRAAAIALCATAALWLRRQRCNPRRAAAKLAPTRCHLRLRLRRCRRGRRSPLYLHRHVEARHPQGAPEIVPARTVRPHLQPIARAEEGRRR